MDDDNSKEGQPSTSEKESAKGPGSEAGNKQEDGLDSRMESESSMSSCMTVNSRFEVASNRHKAPKPPIGPKDSKLQDKKKNRRTPSGRIEKRPNTRRRNVKKTYRRRIFRDRATRKKRKPSMLTIFTPLSSRSASPVNVRCQYCGHRCCRRRYKNARELAFKKRRERKRLKTAVKKMKKYQEKRGIRVQEKKKCKQILRSEGLQAGSTSLMLSPLCENKADVPTLDATEVPVQAPLYCEITPEMIYEAMRRLTMWRQDVATMAILEYIKRNYPVCQDIPALFEELANKINVAAKVAIIKPSGIGRWQLSGALDKRQLSPNHVSLFWDLYADTMKPVTKKAGLPSLNDEQNNETQTIKKPKDEKTKGKLEYEMI